MAAPTLLLCIGATKAGTTWLYDYLRKHPDCHLQSVKELHYFDTRKGQGRGFYLEHADRRLQELAGRRAQAGLLKRRKFDAQIRSVEAWRALIADPGPDHARYWAYLTAGARGAKLVADITPCYATLDREDFAEMASVAADVRFLFLLRDPVDRAWSQARMNGKRRAAIYGKRPAPEATMRSFHRFLDGAEPRFALRSDYARTLTELFAAVPRERVHVEFYETLFTPGALRRITDFLGIAPREGEFDKVSHPGQQLPLAAGEAARAAEVLKDQYAFCDRFFEGRLPPRWRAQMAEGGHHG